MAIYMVEFDCICVDLFLYLIDMMEMEEVEENGTESILHHTNSISNNNVHT